MVMAMEVGWGEVWGEVGGEVEGALCASKCLILVREGKVQRDMGRVLDSK